MRERSWVRGENLLVEELWAEGQVERLPGLIDKVVLRNPISHTAMAMNARRGTLVLPLRAIAILQI